MSNINEEKVMENYKYYIREFELALKAHNNELTDEEEIKEFQGIYPDYDPEGEFNITDFLVENILSYEDDSEYRAKAIVLSYGGPSERFLKFDRLDKITFEYTDWGYYKEIELWGDDKEIMEQIFDILGD